MIRIIIKKIHEKIKKNLYDIANVLASVKMVAEVSIDKNGSLFSCSILQSSGIEKLDKAFLKAIQKSAPFNVFPPEIKDDTITIKIEIFYNFRFRRAY